MLGFGLISGVVKVFLVSALSLARNRPGTTRPDDEMGSQIGHVNSPRACTSTCLDRDERPRDQFKITFRHQDGSFLVDFLANERELTKKTFTTPLISPNPNILCEIHFPWSSL